VLELIYLGDHVRARVALADSKEFILKIPNTAQAAPLTPRQGITVGWHTRDCMALDPL